MAITNLRPRAGMVLVLVLALSWIFPTAGIALAIWTERAGPWVRIASWISLWVFSVLTPTLSTLTIHRALARVAGGARWEERSLDELDRLRPFLLLSANMAFLSACALIFQH